MNSTHIHLLLNHFPIIGTMIGSALLLWAMIKNQNNIKSTAAVIFALLAIIAIPVYLTGETAEESIEKLPGISESMIELHENAANVAIVLMSITGFIALVALFFSYTKRKSASLLYRLLFISSIICFGAMARTGYYGGQIRHTEISNVNSGVQNEKNKNEGIGKPEEKEKDDDD